jgi:sigma-B regulation protein RsbU (phosphoserine phosphatase)
MAPTTALVVTTTAESDSTLIPALRSAGYDVRTVHESALAEYAGPRSDVAVVSASLGLSRVTEIAQRLDRHSVLVFEEGDVAALESCVRGGFDYVAPPFSAELLRGRLDSCWERGQLAVTVAELTVRASLGDYERDLAIAHDIQADFLPEALPNAKGWQFAARFRPAKLVAGDFYDGFDLVNGRRLGFVVADVCDKGIGAALFMALIRTLLRHTAEHTGTGDVWDEGADVASLGATGDPHSSPLSVGAGPLIQAVIGTNRYMANNHRRQGYFATLFFGVLDPASGALLYINCGHHPPVIVRADGGRTLLPPTGPAVGMWPDSAFSLGHAFLAPGDSLLVYTDGVVEARDEDGRQLGTDRVLAAAGPATSAETLLDGVDSVLHRHVGAAEQSDDITMLGLHRTRVT